MRDRIDSFFESDTVEDCDGTVGCTEAVWLLRDASAHLAEIDTLLGCLSSIELTNHERVERIRKLVEARPKWVKTADAMPQPGEYVLIVMVNAHGKTRRLRAMYAAEKTLEAYYDSDLETADYDEETDTYYVATGWYEANEFDECYWRIDGEVIAWMPLPAWPEGE